MARPTRVRSPETHDFVAGEVLRRHSVGFNWDVSMPVPIEAIVEQTFGLNIEWDTIEEEPGCKVLGALIPATKTIVLNETHEPMFTAWLGPYEFTLAHELAHWIYDADTNLGVEPGRFCYFRDSERLPSEMRTRETNANRLAACLLMPRDLVQAADLDDLVVHTREHAAMWGVSRQALSIRMEELGLVDP